MIVVSDTSPVSGLLIIDRLFILQKLYSQVIIPPSVYSELIKSFEPHLLRQHDWIVVRKTSLQDHVNKLFQRLDLGEAEAITLSLELKSDFLLIDAKRGRRIATNLVRR